MTTYKQELATPEEVQYNPQTKEILIVSKQGSFKGTGRTIVWRLARFLGGYEIARVEEEENLGKVLTEAAKKANRELVMLLDREGNLVNVASQVHKQLPLPTLYGTVEKILKETFTELGNREPIGRSVRWPLGTKFEWFEGYIVLSPGSNNPAGRSAMYMSSGFVTTKSIIKDAPACLNWSRFWGSVGRMANIDVARVHAETTKFQEHTLREVHTKGDDKFEELPAIAKDLAADLVAVNAQIGEAVSERLTRQEMQAILVAYNVQGKLPGYIIEEILKQVEQESVWGFAQAISWIGTHGELRGKGEYKQLADNLAKISGEVVSLCAFIKDLHAEFGPITEELLFKPPEKIASTEKPVALPEPKPVKPPKPPKEPKAPKAPKAKKEKAPAKEKPAKAAPAKKETKKKSSK